MADAIESEELNFISQAADYLERPSFLIQIANYAGQPLEALAEALPEKVEAAVENALRSAMSLAISTIPRTPRDQSGIAAIDQKNWWNRFKNTAVTGVTGAVGGAIGWAALPIELPITTCLMFRSIASIAYGYGYDLDDPNTRLDCLLVFSMGGPNDDDDEIDSAYLSLRTAFARLVEDAARHVARATVMQASDALVDAAAPVLVQLISKMAAKFKIVVTQKMLGQAIPIFGAAGGAAINVAFSNHFSNVARYHFGVQSLERKYGKEIVQKLYREAARPIRAVKRTKQATPAPIN